MTIRPCKCGATPKFSRRQSGVIYIIRLECKCGRHGATLMFSKPDDRLKMERAAVDGWNIGE